MKDCDYTLELSDGTVVRVGAMADSRHPDIKAFFFPAGALTPFSHKNLPTARPSQPQSQGAYSSSL
ncbi:hypothetical protein Mal15_08480 [Stieleria maiorica]|uniref:Uncharacterized protein n=1 Tax=Stieleria maiorica TaxID=2795974 RepID=A0A5B9M6J9_9BACT|nr:hypothetical protein Mal15_08480 [Stieleria maiorica]